MESWRIGFDGQSPIYRQIVSRFARSVVRGELTPGDRVPSIRDTALALKVNTNTVQRAYQEMERKRMIFSQRGTGYFVAPDSQTADRIRAEMVHESVGRFLDEMRSLGFGDAQILDALTDAVRNADTAVTSAAADVIPGMDAAAARGAETAPCADVIPETGAAAAAGAAGAVFEKEGI
jgi:GntR family transcriptional regulator